VGALLGRSHPPLPPGVTLGLEPRALHLLNPHRSTASSGQARGWRPWAARSAGWGGLLSPARV